MGYSYWEPTGGSSGQGDPRVANTVPDDLSSRCYEAWLNVEYRLKRWIAAKGVFGIEPCCFCGKLFRTAEPATLFNGNGEMVCIDCVREWWPKRYEQLGRMDRKFLERRLAQWLVKYHHGRSVRQFEFVRQIPLQEFLIVTTCAECGGSGINCGYCDGHGTVWIVAPE